MLKVSPGTFSITTHLFCCLVCSKKEYVAVHLQMTLDEHSSPEEAIALPSYHWEGGQHLKREYYEHKANEKPPSNDWWSSRDNSFNVCGDVSLRPMGFETFKESLKEQPEVSPMASSWTETVTNTHIKKSPPAKTTTPTTLTQHNIDLESDGLEIETPSLEMLDSLIDELLLSEVEPSEAATLDVQGENLEGDIDIGSDLESLIPILTGQVDIEPGASEDIVIVAEIFKRSLALGGSIAINDLITMIEAMLRIEPDRPQLQSILLQLRNDKEKSLQDGVETTYMLDYTTN